MRPTTQRQRARRGFRFQRLPGSPAESGYPLSAPGPAACPQGPPFHATIGLFRFWLLLHGNSCSMPLAAATWLPMLLATPPVGHSVSATSQ